MDIEIIVLVKQVPLTGEVEVDPETGNLQREGVASQTNPYDLHALEAALAVREECGGHVTALSMGPPQAETTLREAFSLGVDRGILLSDPAFAGADTLATAYTLSRALRKLPHDLILAGMQTTDGDTAQVGPGVAEFLGIPHASYVDEVVAVADGTIRAVVDAGEGEQLLELEFPALLTVTREANGPRLPSFKLRLATADREVETWTREDLAGDGDASGCDDFFGLDGSPTWVERIFPPPANPERETWRGEPRELAVRLMAKLEEWRYL